MEWLRLLGCGLCGRGRGGLAGIGVGYLAAEALDAACGVDQLLLAGKERVALRADFDDDVAFVGGAGLKVIAAGALNVDGRVLRVNSFFWHLKISLSWLKSIAFRLGCRLPARGSLATGAVTVTSIYLSRRPQSSCRLGTWEHDGMRLVV